MVAFLDPELAASAPRSKVHFVYEALKEAILSGRLKPGDELVQSRIAKSLKVSAIPVMAAMRQLIAEGLVTQEPHHPAKVATFSREGLEERSVIRMHLEVLATRLSVPHVGVDGVAELRDLLRLMEEALEQDDLPLYGELNKSFHLRIYEACPYRLLAQMIQDLWDNTDRRGLRSMFTIDLARKSHSDHKDLVDLIEQGKPDDAGKLVERHKGRFRSTTVPETPE